MIYCNASHLHTNQKLWSVYRHLAKDASSFDILYTQKTKAHTFVHNCKWICEYKWWFHVVNILYLYLYIWNGCQNNKLCMWYQSISMDSASDILVFVTMHINRLVYWKNNKNKTFLQPRNTLSPVFFSVDFAHNWWNKALAPNILFPDLKSLETMGR